MQKYHSELEKEFKKLLAEVGDDLEFLSVKPADYSPSQDRCGVNRHKKKGFCKTGVESYFSSEFLHVGEEVELIPSHTIFFSRCTFACVSCQNYDIVYDDDYKAIPKELAER